MQVTKVSASVRYSRALAQGEHKTVELSAEASVEEGEQWTLCQQGLFAQLSAQLREVWGWGQNGHPQNGHERPKEEVQSLPPAEEKPAPQPHWCPEHQTEFRKFEKAGKAWYSHKVPDGSWCKE